MMSRHFALNSELTGAIAKRLPRVSAISPTNSIIVPFRLLNEMHCLTRIVMFYVLYGFACSMKWVV